jgi:hypothetical protein
MPDVDIDVANRNHALSDLRYVPAVEMRQRQRVRHPCSVYFQDIPVDPLDHMAVWDFRTATAKGYFDVDLIHNTIYDHVRDETHLVALLAREPPWERFDDPATVAKLAHIHDYYYIVQIIRPRNIIDVAICIALPRPGKRHLTYRPRAEIDREIWLPVVTDPGQKKKYYYKKSHAIAYAASIIVQLNLLIEHEQ